MSNVLQNTRYEDPSFVDFEAARELTPEVFTAKYNAQDPKRYPDSDRLVLRAMAKHYAADPSVVRKVDNAFKIEQSGTRNHTTPSTQDSYDMLLDRARQYRIPSSSEHIELFRIMKIGVAAFKLLNGASSQETSDVLDGLAREGTFCYQSIFTCNLRLAVKPVNKRKMQNKHVEKKVLMAYAHDGLQTAIEKFDETRGNTLSTYATPWIEQAIDRGLANESRNVRIPVNVAGELSTLDYARSALMGELRREPTDEELMEFTNIKTEDIDRVRQLGENYMISLDRVVSEDGTTELIDLIESTTESTESEIRHLVSETNLQRLMNEAGLSATESEVLCRKYGLRGHEDQTMQEIGDALGLRKGNLSSILIKARNKLKQSIPREELSSHS